MTDTKKLTRVEQLPRVRYQEYHGDWKDGVDRDDAIAANRADIAEAETAAEKRGADRGRIETLKEAHDMLWKIRNGSVSFRDGYQQLVEWAAAKDEEEAKIDAQR